MIRYVDSPDEIHPDMLQGFFEGWRRSIPPEEHFGLLRGSDHVMLALAGADAGLDAAGAKGCAAARAL
mgnify:CR=1 FL=1|jgi:hypothetical protein